MVILIYAAGWYLSWLFDSVMCGFVMVLVTISMLPLMVIGSIQSTFPDEKNSHTDS